MLRRPTRSTRTDTLVPYTTLFLACYGTDEQGQAIPPNDPNWEVLTATAHEAKQHPARWIDMRASYGDLADNRAFVATFTEALDLVWSQGIDAAMLRYVAEIGRAQV